MVESQVCWRGGRFNIVLGGPRLAKAHIMWPSRCPSHCPIRKACPIRPSWNLPELLPCTTVWSSEESIQPIKMTPNDNATQLHQILCLINPFVQTALLAPSAKLNANALTLFDCLFGEGPTWTLPHAMIFPTISWAVYIRLALDWSLFKTLYFDHPHQAV